MSVVRVVAVALLLSLLGGCYVYDPYYHPYPHQAPPPKFDQAWNAAVGAFVDQGVEILRYRFLEMAASGTRNDSDVLDSVSTAADKARGNVADDPRHRGIVGDVAGKGGGIDLVMRGQLARHALGLVATLRVHDGDMCALLSQRVADALAEPAIATRY